MTALRRAVEAGPFYTLSSSAGVGACRVNQDADSIRLEYTFRDGTTLRITHNPRIEYTDQDLRLSSPLTEDPVTVLTRTERAAFPDKGCGINWQEPETLPATDDAKTTERVYRGETCNCQARVRRDPSGRTIGLLFRSAC